MESIAYRHDQERVNLQRFLGLAPWEHQPLREEPASQVGDEPKLLDIPLNTNIRVMKLGYFCIDTCKTIS